jgi:hypothetical protein
MVGWPSRRAFPVARELSDTMQDRAVPSSSWIKTWSPILGELQTGHYLAASLDLPVEHVTCEESSWFTLRQFLRTWNEVEDGPLDICSSWPGIAHFQGPSFAGEITSFWIVLPSRDISELDERTVDYYVEAIGQGRRPTVLTLGWLEERYVMAEWYERFVLLFVLDGHHKLEAYSRCAVPASTIALFRLESTWGPPHDRSKDLIKAIRQLRHERGQMSADVARYPPGS